MEPGASIDEGANNLQPPTPNTRHPLLHIQWLHALIGLPCVLDTDAV
jgi:hypothetical protein